MITIEEESDSDWILVWDKVVKLPEDFKSAFVALDIWREIVDTDAEKDPRILPGHAYNLPALPSTSIALGAHPRALTVFVVF